MKDMKPLVSVNLTTYNRAHLLPRVLGSILGQTYPNLEIIVVDDCSTDNTAEIVSFYQTRDKRIKYFRHDINKKLAHARNTGWKASNGKYIAFMDDDDEWIDPKKMEKQVQLLETTSDKNIAIICSGVRLYQNNTIFKDKIISKPQNLISAILSGNGIIYTPAVMMPRKVIKKVGGFDTNMPKGVDSELYRTCIVKYGYEVHFMPEITTAVHEYGDGRMTPVVDVFATRKTIYANSYLVKKYLCNYLTHPVALFKRIKIIGVLIFRYVKNS